jgi:hypothetical protein
MWSRCCWNRRRSAVALCTRYNKLCGRLKLPLGVHDRQDTKATVCIRRMLTDALRMMVAGCCRRQESPHLPNHSFRHADAPSWVDAQQGSPRPVLSPPCKQIKRFLVLACNSYHLVLRLLFFLANWCVAHEQAATIYPTPVAFL